MDIEERDERQPEATDDVGVDAGQAPLSGDSGGEAPPPDEDEARNPPEDLERLKGA